MQSLLNEVTTRGPRSSTHSMEYRRPVAAPRTVSRNSHGDFVAKLWRTLTAPADWPRIRVRLRLVVPTVPMRSTEIVPVSVALAVVLGALVATSQPVPRPAGSDAGARAAQTPTASATPSGRNFGGVSEDRILDAIRNGRILSRRNVGSTSVNLHLHLAGEIDAAWKPCTTAHCESYRAEIAAYRLNRILGLNRVPPAISRTVLRASLRLPEDTTVQFDRFGNARGAAIYWVPVLRDSMIDREHDMERWGRWLRQGHDIPADQSVRAEEIATLLTFDFLTGNWDRWSGSNVPMDATGHLIYRDNNGGFEEPFVQGLMQRSTALLRRTQKFSRAVIDRARAMTEASVRAEMALDGDRAHPPLTDSQIRSLLRRRDALIEYVDGLVTRHGAARVYAW